MGVLMLTIILVFVFAAILLLSRGGAKEPATVSGPPVEALPRVELKDIGDVTERLLNRLALTIETREPDDGRGPGYIARTADQVTGGKIYIRAFKLPEGERVNSQDVQAAILTARDEGMSKAILIAPNGFSDDAILAAEDTATELIDGPKLEMLLKG
jgi:hypothetical protein